MAPLDHPKEEVRKALKQARAAGWSVAKAKGRTGHTWGFVVCPGGSCRVAVWGSPRTQENLARYIRSKVATCRCRSSREEGA